MIQIQTLSDFKKAVKLGTKISGTHHMKFNGRDEQGNVLYTDAPLPTREVSIVQSNSFALKTTKTTGEVVDSWCYYPKAKECTFADNVITIHEENREGKLIPVLSYKIEE